MIKNLLHSYRDRVLTVFVLLIMILTLTQCEGMKYLYLINNSSDQVTIKSRKSHDYLLQAPVEYYSQRRLDIDSKLRDSSFLRKLQIDYFQIIYDTKCSIETIGDTICFELKPGESIKIVDTPWLFFPGRIKEQSLKFDNLLIITNSDTYILRSRKEVLSLKRIKGLVLKKVIERK